MLPTAQHDFALAQNCGPEPAAPAAAPCQQPYDSKQCASACGPYQAGCSSGQCAQPYSRPLFAAAPEANSSQHHPLWDFASHSPHHTVAVGWPVPESTAPMQCLTSCALVSTQAASAECQTQAAAALPVQQQQHQTYGKHKGHSGVSPGQMKDSQVILSLQPQKSCCSSVVCALRDSPCMVPGAEPFPAAVDTNTTEQSSALPRGADCQQDPDGTDLHMLASTAAYHNFGQVLLLLECFNTLCVPTLSKEPHSHSIASIVQPWLQATCNESSLLNHSPAGCFVLYCHGSNHIVTTSEAVVLPHPLQLSGCLARSSQHCCTFS